MKMTNIEHILQAQKIWPNCNIEQSHNFISIDNISDTGFEISIDKNGNMELNLGPQLIARTADRHTLLTNPEMKLTYFDNFVRNWDFYDDWESIVMGELNFCSVTKRAAAYRMGNELSTQLNGVKYQIMLSHYSPKCIIISSVSPHAPSESMECGVVTVKRSLFELHDKHIDSLTRHYNLIGDEISSYKRLKDAELSR
jgi:hypothetical protein